MNKVQVVHEVLRQKKYLDILYIEALKRCMWLSTLPHKHECACKAALVWSRDLCFITPWSKAVSESHVLIRSEINSILT